MLTDNTMRPQNIILFSAGESLRNGVADRIKKMITDNGHEYHDWKDLFSTSLNKKNIALLPMLLKKIPTFDYAVILGESVDSLGKFRKTEEEIKIMRDNVLFEIGLCIMALGTDRVILITDEETRIPEDLMGIGKLGIKSLILHGVDQDYVLKDEINSIIEGNKKEMSPVVIGAAITTADGYLNNYVMRFWNNIDNEYTVDGKVESFCDKIRFLILVPERIDGDIRKRILKYYDKEGYKTGIIKTNDFRTTMEFRFKIVGDEMIVCDIPTTITASYDTVVEILDIKADDVEDKGARERFLQKEADSFIYTFNKLMLKMMNDDVPMAKRMHDNTTIRRQRLHDLV